MNAKILDTHVENGKTCYLCRISLEEYISSLDNDYDEYDIQREIVKNVYLEKLIDTVLQKKHIPPIVLVVEEGESRKSNDVLKVNRFKILDGLQRTTRLKSISDTILLADEEIKKYPDLKNYTLHKLSREFSVRLKAIKSNAHILQAILENHNKAHACFTNNYQWFEIWEGLDADQEVEKMLVLNAGHKPVKPKHQLELLFLNLLPHLKKSQISGFVLYRERDRSSIVFSKVRKAGEFHFAHIIAALLSFVNGKPITTNPQLLEKMNNDDEIDSFLQVFSASFLKNFVQALVKIDLLIEKQYAATGVKWLGREVSLTGLFAALGKMAQTNNVPVSKAELDAFHSLLQANPKLLSLEDYEGQRNNMNLGKINFGKVNKDAIYDAIFHVLQSGKKPQTISWQDFFGGKSR